MRSKTGTAVTSAFQSIFKDPRYVRRRPVWVRTDKGKEFLNKKFTEMLKREGIQFHVCKNPDVKCSVVERAERTIRDRLYKYFTYKNRYRYIDVLQHGSLLHGHGTVYSDRFGYSRHMEENERKEASHSCRSCEIPRRATRAHQ